MRVSGRLCCDLKTGIPESARFSPRRKICQRLFLFSQCEPTDCAPISPLFLGGEISIFFVSLSSRLSIISQTCLEGRVLGFVAGERQDCQLSTRTAGSIFSSVSAYRARIWKTKNKNFAFHTKRCVLSAILPCFHIQSDWHTYTSWRRILYTCVFPSLRSRGISARVSGRVR